MVELTCLSPAPTNETKEIDHYHQSIHQFQIFLWQTKMAPAADWLRDDVGDEDVRVQGDMKVRGAPCEPVISFNNHVTQPGVSLLDTHLVLADLRQKPFSFVYCRHIAFLLLSATGCGSRLPFGVTRINFLHNYWRQTPNELLSQ